MSPAWSSQPSPSLTATPQCPREWPSSGISAISSVQALDHADAVEAHPLVAAGLVGDPLRPVLEVRAGGSGTRSRSVGSSAARCSAPNTWTSASGKSGSPPAWSTSRWVTVMWRTSPGSSPVPGSARSRCPRRRGLGCRRGLERDAETAIGVLGVVHAEACIDQDELITGLDQQAVADDLGGAKTALAGDEALAQRAQTAAVEVMDARHVAREPTACTRSEDPFAVADAPPSINNRASDGAYGGPHE